MGNCTDVKKDLIYNPKKFKQQQSELLHLMYDDLAQRSLEKGIRRDHFEVFFNLNGLWSASIYRKFDNHVKGYISYDDFSKNLLSMTKGDFKQKSQVLYELYSDGQSSGVTFQMLTKMFYSYPKEEINKILYEKEFLKTIKQYQITCFFDQEHKIKDNITFQLNQSYTNLGMIKNPIQSIQQKKDKQSPVKKNMIQKTRPQHQYVQRQSMQSMILQGKQLSQRSNSKRKSRKLSYNENKKVQKKRFKLTSNISFLVKKYVAYLFKTFDVDKSHGSLNLDQFRILLTNHQKIFDIYFEGFHTYIWRYNNQGVPLLNKMKANFESDAVEISKTIRQNCQLKLIKSTLFVFASNEPITPLRIVNLQGLYVKESELFENCFLIYHRDGIYPEKQYQVESKQLKAQWMMQLRDFIKGNIKDDFEFKETVGTGKFSKVFYGKEKATNHEVAIKVIEKCQLSQHEKQAIQKECQILQLCHCPYIIKFYKNYETKNSLCIITEYLKQGDLFQYVKEKVFLQEYEAALIFKQLLEAIKYLNELGLIHRDLKPENVMVQLNQHKTMINKVKLIDFGFAVFKKDLQFTHKHEKYVGTPGYIAPQILDGQTYDESADLFSLGIILHFMLCGKLPFYSQKYEQIVQLTKICYLSLTNQHWTKISKPARQLVEGLIAYKDDRLNFKQVLDHQWLKDIQSLKQFNKLNAKPNHR